MPDLLTRPSRWRYPGLGWVVAPCETPDGQVVVALGEAMIEFNQTLGNPNLEPEFTKSVEAGINLGFFQNQTP